MSSSPVARQPGYANGHYGNHHHGNHHDGTARDTNENQRAPIREFGHEYHWSNRLVVPHDPSELGYQHYQHELFRHCLGEQLTFGSLPPVGFDEYSILDVGTGSAIWAIEMGKCFPQADIFGIDISPALFPRPFNVPSNVGLFVRDATQPWSMGDFNLIFMRDLVGGGIRDWRGLLAQAFSHLRPGGQLEFAQLDCFLSAGAQSTESQGTFGPRSAEHRARFMELCGSQFITFDPIPLVVPCLCAMPGVHFVAQQVLYLPTKVRDGACSEEIKRVAMVQKILPLLLENRSLRLFRRSGMRERTVRELIQGVLEEQQDPAYDAYLKMTIIIATKMVWEAT
ncbi:hypothetical protein NOR_07444 [Metarhizium rileyi]|uniref:S-adenosyl-L-methionine-dependent methyltransferase n=1 Tax=Metarhizium rileyi (strain RCEF 4871) TaxID=1649241 RepID=A0A166Y8R2_METRR|nr:hypothetical protein NOR_07444 [Metarhizium rileyi RCEF 4871]